MFKLGKRFLVTSPLGRTIGFFLSIIVSGILCGTFVTEITRNGVIIWSLSGESKSFYLILFFLLFVYLYNKILYDEDVKIQNFADKDYCKAYLRKNTMNEFAKKVCDDLKNGKPLDQNLKDFESFMRDFMQ